LLNNAKELRCKESDRIKSMANGLQNIGIKVQVFDDGIMIEGAKLKGGVVDSYGDHRIAMAFAIAGAAATAPIKIMNCDNVDTSFPAFVKTANKVNCAVNISYQ
jgi:3-phosphoshikimate 1-carboxyvinyltransferase